MAKGRLQNEKKGKCANFSHVGGPLPPSMEIPCLWGFFGFILHLIPFSWNFFPEWAFSDQIDQISPPSNCTTCFSISERFWHAKNQVSFQIKCDLRRPPSLFWRNSHIFLFFSFLRCPQLDWQRERSVTYLHYVIVLAAAGACKGYTKPTLTFPTSQKCRSIFYWTAPLKMLQSDNKRRKNIFTWFFFLDKWFALILWLSRDKLQIGLATQRKRQLPPPHRSRPKLKQWTSWCDVMGDQIIWRWCM